ncbi:MAG: glycosyl transferase family 1, partial [Bacteroidales bacterium]|nr:glycosyl transferase family 1 [Bacteroidales bacterium]
MKQSSTPRFRNVLVARFSALGDVAMTVPVIYSVCRENPATRFIIITQPVAATIFINAPANLVVVSTDTKVHFHGIGGLIRLANMLIDKYQIDAFADLHDVLRTWILGTLLRMRG